MPTDTPTPATADRPDTLALAKELRAVWMNDTKSEFTTWETTTEFNRNDWLRLARHVRALPRPSPLDAGVVERLRFELLLACKHGSLPMVNTSDLRAVLAHLGIVGAVDKCGDKCRMIGSDNVCILDKGHTGWEHVSADGTRWGMMPIEPAKAEAAKPQTNRELLATLPVGSVVRRKCWDFGVTPGIKWQNDWRGIEVGIHGDEPADGPLGIVVVSRPAAAPPAPASSDVCSGCSNSIKKCDCKPPSVEPPGGAGDIERRYVARLEQVAWLLRENESLRMLLADQLAARAAK